MNTEDNLLGSGAPPRRWYGAARDTHPAVALIILSSASFLAALDVWITQVGLRSIGHGVRETSLSNLSWVLSAYAIVYAALLVPSGRLADRYGRKPAFLLGLGLFTLASLGDALSGQIWVLVAFRTLQAVGAAMMTPSSLGLVLTTAPAEKVSQYVKVWFTSAALAASAGPLVGGLLVQVSWRWIFLINLPIGLAGVVAAARFLPDTRHDRRTQFPDLVGGVLLMLGVGALAFGVVKAPDWGWGSGRVIAALVVAAVATLVFLASSRRHPAPVIELGLFRDRVFASANVANWLFFMAFSIELLSVILWLQGHWHFSAIKTGLASAPGPAVVPIFATLAENLQMRLKVKPGVIAAGGLLLAAGGAIIFATQLTQHVHYPSEFLPGWLMVGAGAGLALPTVVSSATVSLRADQTATGSAIVSMGQQIGAVVGVSVLVAILGTASATAPLAVFRHAWITAAVMATAAIAGAIGITPKDAAATVPDATDIPDGVLATDSAA